MWNASNQSRPNPGDGSPPPTNPLRAAGIWPLLLLVMISAIVWSTVGSPKARTEIVTYSTFLDQVKQGKVAAVTIHAGYLEGRRPPAADASAGAPGAGFYVELGQQPSEQLEQTLVEQGVEVTYQQPSGLATALYTLAFFAVMILIMVTMMRRANPAERAMSFGKSRARQYIERDVRVTFDDVAGIEEPKAELQEIVEYLRTPEKFRRLGGRIPKGVLLVGVPGTGKTLLAKAVAGEAKVPFFSMSGSDFVELFVGVGASRVRDLFRQAEAHNPCILFIDELDALGKARGQAMLGGGHDEREQTLNQLLVEMDGFESNTNVIVMGATNRPEILDPALMRPGRFDRQVVIPAPDIRGRQAILEVHARDKKVDPAVNLRQVAARTPGFVGADLANVVNEAALLAARRDRDQVTFEDFDEAIDRVSVGLERRSHVISDEEKRITAYHEAGHALVSAYSAHGDPVHKVSIIPRGVAGGYTQFLPNSDRTLVTRAKLRDWMAVGLAGRVAEELFLPDISSGASNDIKRVTDLARAMVTELGMSETLGPIYYETKPSGPDLLGLSLSGSRPISEATAQQIDSEVHALVSAAYEQARRLLHEHRDALQRLALRLLEIEVVDRDELYGLLHLPLPPEHGSGADQDSITPPGSPPPPSS